VFCSSLAYPNLLGTKRLGCWFSVLFKFETTFLISMPVSCLILGTYYLFSSFLHSSSYLMTQVAALVPKTELDGDMGDAHVALQARLMSQALRKLSHSLSLSQTIQATRRQDYFSEVAYWGFGF
jgi:hypothetical protein